MTAYKPPRFWPVRRAYLLARDHVVTGIRELPTPRSPISIRVRVEVRRGAMTREEWLHHAADALRPLLAEVRVHGRAVTFPTRTRFAVGYGGDSARYEHKTGGVCCPGFGSADGQPQIFVSPAYDDEVDVLAILLHEVTHASDDCRSGHRGHFAHVIRALGFEGTPSSGVPGDDLRRRLRAIAFRLVIEHGRYPHAALWASRRPQ